MGTRHSQTVITKEGEVKIRQYGQWDGYPEGQGVGILEYLKNGNLDKYQENLSSIPIINDEQSKLVEEDVNWKIEYPYLHRDCGCNIHEMIEDGFVKFVAHIDTEEANEWCEGFYTIDFQKGVFITEYYDNIIEIKLNDLPSKDDYLKMFKDEDED